MAYSWDIEIIDRRIILTPTVTIKDALNKTVFYQCKSYLSDACEGPPRRKGLFELGRQQKRQKRQTRGVLGITEKVLSKKNAED